MSESDYSISNPKVANKIRGIMDKNLNKMNARCGCREIGRKKEFCIQHIPLEILGIKKALVIK